LGIGGGGDDGGTVGRAVTVAAGADALEVEEGALRVILGLIPPLAVTEPVADGDAFDGGDGCWVTVCRPPSCRRSRLCAFGCDPCRCDQDREKLSRKVCFQELSNKSG
jgi:hypothetical protein